MLIANAWHARSDAASSLVAAAGIGGSLLGWRWLDPVAALIVGFMILRMGAVFAWEAVRELMDEGLSAQELDAIKATLASTPGVVDLHELRTRRMADRALVDAHIRVDPRISVSEGHRIAETARHRVLQSHPDVLDVLVHVDAEDDSTHPPAADLPDRATLENHLRELLGGPAAPAFDRVVLHYLGRRVEAEIFFPANTAADQLAMAEKHLFDHLPGDPWVSKVIAHTRVSDVH
jgi:hypothetical protein